MIALYFPVAFVHMIFITISKEIFAKYHALVRTIISRDTIILRSKKPHIKLEQYLIKAFKTRDLVQLSFLIISLI
jgi:hypothetical protein